MFEKHIQAIALFAAMLIAATVAPAQVEINTNTFGGLRARAIGPAVMSGRIAAIDAVGTDPLTIFAGAATGGVWRSKDGGITWRAVFDDHPQSIGAIRVDPSNPETIWVGTGETWGRNSVSIGTGLYKSVDGGDSWSLVGLEDSERIARIEVDPGDSDKVFVCATGHLWNANDERGVYKTTDGGESWEQILSVDENTGCADLSMDPQNPNVVYASMWEFRRSPDFFVSGGPGSGLFRTMDGGANWTELRNGLPQGDLGRIGVAVAPSRPSRVYAVVEADDTAMYRSDDLGGTWEEINSSFNVVARPFYFAHVVVDPTDYDRVYKPGFFLGISTDGGKAFTSLFSGAFGSVHSDHHAFWINPNNPKEVILGTDGGVYMSYDGGANFRFVKALPLSQFYEVSADMATPYNVYGGLQDNGSWVGPSRAPGGVQNQHWSMVGFGDGFHTYTDPFDHNIIYAEYQGGQLLKHLRETAEVKYIAPQPGEGEEPFRFNWNAALHPSPTTEATIYYGAEYLFRSRDRGESWERISPDLTTNDPARQRQSQSGGLTIDNTTAENNTTIYSISESPMNTEIVWVGTDDGNVQVTQDGGGSWTNVRANFEGVPDGTWVSHVEASPHEEGTAHVTFDGHRAGDMTPYIYRTTDFGQSWTALATEDVLGFAHVVVQDLVNPELLFVGTEMGLYLTVDGGQQWARFGGTLPMVPVRDVDIHPRDHDLIIGTHGRGIFILDDLTPLRALTTEVLDSKFAILPARDSVMTLSGGMSWFSGHDEFAGENPPDAASLFFYQKKRHIFGDLKLEVYDEAGELLSTVPVPKVKGLNRADWPMRMPPPKMPAASNLVPAFVGPRVPEGTYTFKLIKGKETFEAKVNLVPDPRTPHSAEDRKLQQTTALELYDMLADLTYLIESSVDLKEQSEARVEELGGKGRAASRLEDLVASLEEYRGQLLSTSEDGIFAGDEKLREHMGNLYGAVTGFDGRPTQSQLERIEVFKSDMAEATSTFGTLTSESSLSALNSQLSGKGLEPLVLQSREDWDAAAAEGGGATAANLSVKQQKRIAMWGFQFSLGF